MSALLALAAVSAVLYPQGFCKATDGDTVRCGQERVRVAEIDAPELRGHCRRGRVCAPGDAKASKRSVEIFLQGGQARVERYSVDHYGRTVGDVLVRGRGLACWQVSRGQAIVQKSGATTACCVGAAGGSSELWQRVHTRGAGAG